MIEIIPAIDLIDGKCVRLTQGDFSRSETYDQSPLDIAKLFEAAGLKRLHIVDLDGAKNGKVRNQKVLELLAKETDLAIDFGGGIRTDADVRDVFNAGAAMISIGSIAVKEPDRFFKWLDQYGGTRFLFGADARGKNIAINGWQTETSFEILPFLTRYSARGVERVFVTDISKDGVLAGPAIQLYRSILRSFPKLKLIASGGVSSVRDIENLNEIGCTGVIIGKAIYEGRIRLEQLTQYVS